MPVRGREGKNGTDLSRGAASLMEVHMTVLEDEF